MHSSEQPSRGIPGWLKVIAVMLLIAFLGAGLIYVMGLNATRRWNQLTQLLHEKGQPVTLHEIEARRPVIPDEENIARLIERIMETHVELPGDGHVPPEVFVFGTSSLDFFAQLNRDHVQKSREYLEEYEAILQDLMPILELKSGRIALDLSQPAIMLLLPDLGGMRSLRKLSRLKASISLIDGHTTDAVTHMLVQLRMADSLDGDPIVIARLVQMGIESTAADSVEDCLRAAEPGRDAIADLAAALDRRLQQARIQPALLGERAMFVDTCASILDGRLAPATVASVSGPAAGWLSVLPKVPVWLVRENQIKGTEMLTWLVDAGEDLAALSAAGTKLDAEVPKLSRKYEVVRVMMPSLSRAVTLHIKAIAHLRAARAAVAAEQFRLDRGRLPESLSELVPDYLDSIPIDPFDGQPLRFKATEQGIVIYSIDENMFDEGGEVTVTESNNRAPDVGIRLVRPEYRTIIIVDAPPETDE